MVTGMNFEKMEALSETLSSHIVDYIKLNNLTIGKDIFFLISSDANHYGRDFKNHPFGEDRSAHQEGTDIDKKIVFSYLSGNITNSKIKGLTTRIWGKTYRDYSKTFWCGKYSIPFGMLTTVNVVKKLQMDAQLIGKILRYSSKHGKNIGTRCKEIFLLQRVSVWGNIIAPEKGAVPLQILLLIRRQ